MNIGVVPQAVLGYLTVWPAGQPKPPVSTINSDGPTKSTGAIVPAGGAGAISVFATNTTHVVLDINGYFVPSSNPSALAFYSVTPCRIIDTRRANGPLGGPFIPGGTSRTIPVLSSSCSIPSAAIAYSVSFAAVPHGQLGFLTAWATGGARPLVASLNASTGVTTANAAIVPAGTGGSFDVFPSNDTDLVVDINGYFAPFGAGGLSLYTVQPCRVLDTRNPPGSPSFSGTRNIDVGTSSCGAASGGAASSAVAFVLNATVVPPASLGYLTLWSPNTAQPLASSVNAVDGKISGNLAIVPTSNSCSFLCNPGSINAYASQSTHLVLDLFGYFAP
ncbi:MAG: hypothetical protein M3Z09_18415 [Acidobacteriota bacterium]|nr:hypothetical protein [Acidobacteriota bacterium]